MFKVDCLVYVSAAIIVLFEYSKLLIQRGYTLLGLTECKQVYAYYA